MRRFFMSIFWLACWLLNADDYYRIQIENKEDISYLIENGIDVTSRKGSEVSCLVGDDQLPLIKPFNPQLEPKPRAQSDYRSYDQLTSELEVLAEDNDACTLTSIGTSVQNREIWELKLTAIPENEQGRFPKIAILSTIHGDEPIGVNMAMRLINLLLEPHQHDILSKAIIYFLPAQNPDGLALHRRGNANNVDLNRNFPDGAMNDIGNVFDGPAINSAGCQKETILTMNWCVKHKFALALHLHGGAELVCYPFGNNADGKNEYTAAPDDALFIELAKTYTINNPEMWNSPYYTDGIINSADWYPVDGELADWQYRYTGTPALTVELYYNSVLGSQASKAPSASYLPEIWDNNRDALIASINRACSLAVKGQVIDAKTGEGIAAKFSFTSGSGYNFFSTDNGSYFRTLQSGSYQFTVSAPGLKTKTVSASITNSAVEKRIFLEPLQETISLDAGWNLLSLACEISDTSFEQLKADSILWVWNATDYGKADAVGPGQGFWVYSDAAREVILEPSTTNKLSCQLNAGWNLGGCGYPQSMPKEVPVMDQVWTWSENKYLETSMLHRWHGYWIFALENSTLEWRY